jgi:phosphoserine phosphatase
LNPTQTPDPHASDGLADLVIQGAQLSPQAIAAFCRQFPQAPVQRRLASVRLLAVGPTATVADAVADLAARWRCDVALLARPLVLSHFRVLALDMDSTLIRNECIDELAELAGVGPEVAAITEAAMRGQIADYAQSLRQRVALLAGVDASLLQTVAEQHVQITPGAERLLKAAREAGLRTLLVTGGFGFFARTLQRELGIDAVQANEVQVVDGRLTGIVLGPADRPERLVDAQGKASALRELCAQLGCGPADAIAIGDGANDLPMLELAGVSVAYRAKPLVQQRAQYALNYSGLDGVLELFSG